MFRTTHDSVEPGWDVIPSDVPGDDHGAPLPTLETYRSIRQAHQFFNHALFSSALPEPLFTFQRKARVLGYYSPQRFEQRSAPGMEDTLTAGPGLSDEIALNPATLRVLTDAEVAGVVVHEMAHQWQQHFGRPSRSGYHNAEWADRMDAIGLVPTDSGRPGGRRVGQRVGHWIDPTGPFAAAFDELASSGFRFLWQERQFRTVARRNDRCKFSCPSCGLNAWAKPAAALSCGDCGLPLQAAD